MCVGGGAAGGGGRCGICLHGLYQCVPRGAGGLGDMSSWFVPMCTKGDNPEREISCQTD